MKPNVSLKLYRVSTKYHKILESLDRISKGVGCMKVIVSGKNLHVRDELKETLSEKLSKFDKFFNNDIEAFATLSHIKDQQVVEVTIPLKHGVILRAEETSDNMLTSIDRVVDRLAKQMKKHKTGLEKRYRKHDTIRFEYIPEPEEHYEPKKIVKAKKFPVKPMDPEEAVLQMQMLNHDFFVFLNADTEEVNVVYNRKDGQFGLIEPYV